MRTMASVAAAALLVMSGVRPAAAQKWSVELGVHVDGAWANVAGAGTDSTQSRTTVAVGGIVVVQPPRTIFGLESGISYVNKGAYDAAGGTYALMQLTYVEIPVLLRVAVPLPGSAIRPILSVGPVAGIRTRCRLLAHNDYASASVDCADYALAGRFDFRTVDLSGTAAVSIDIPIGSRLIVFPRFGYARSILTIENRTEPSLPIIYGMNWLANSDVRNTVYEIGVGVRIATG